MSLSLKREGRGELDIAPIEKKVKSETVTENEIQPVCKTPEIKVELRYNENDDWDESKEDIYFDVDEEEWCENIEFSKLWLRGGI